MIGRELQTVITRNDCTVVPLTLVVNGLQLGRLECPDPACPKTTLCEKFLTGKWRTELGSWQRRNPDISALQRLNSQRISETGKANQGIHASFNKASLPPETPLHSLRLPGLAPYIIAPAILKIGRYIATTRPPMVTPRNTSMKGSIRAVMFSTA